MQASDRQVARGWGAACKGKGGEGRLGAPGMVQGRGARRWGAVVGVCLMPEGGIKTREGGELSISSQVILGLGEVTKIEPLRQCLLNCRDASTQEGEAGQVKKQRNYREGSEG